MAAGASSLCGDMRARARTSLPPQDLASPLATTREALSSHSSVRALQRREEEGQWEDGAAGHRSQLAQIVGVTLSLAEMDVCYERMLAELTAGS